MLRTKSKLKSHNSPQAKAARLKRIKKYDNRKEEIVKFVDTNKNGEKFYNIGQIWPNKYDVKLNEVKLTTNGRVYNRNNQELIHEVFIPDLKRILLPNKTYKLIIDYPLTNPYTQEIKTNKNGMTLREVLNIAVDAYKKIYKEEEKTSKLKVESISKRSKGKSLLINRAQTDGKYGIWGHELSDLTITNIIVKGNKIYLSVDS